MHKNELMKIPLKGIQKQEDYSHIQASPKKKNSTQGEKENGVEIKSLDVRTCGLKNKINPSLSAIMTSPFSFTFMSVTRPCLSTTFTAFQCFGRENTERGRK